MPQYKYKALDENGKSVQGQIEYENETSLLKQLKSRSYTVLDIGEVKSNRRLGQLLLLKHRVSLGELDFFSRQLASMLTAGMTVNRSLAVLYQQARAPVWRLALGGITRDVESGASLSAALGGYPHIFFPLYIEMVKAGEISGKLDEMLLSLSRQLAQQKILRDQIRAATLYPAFILIFAGFVMLLLMLFLMPLMISMLPANTPLPWLTATVMKVSLSVGDFWYLYLLSGGAMAFGLRTYLSSARGRALWHRVQFKIPLLGIMWKKAILARFCYLIALLLEAGLPILKVLETTGSALGNVWLNAIIHQVALEIQNGRGVYRSLAMHQFFPPMLINLVEVGEESGRLPELLLKIGESQQEEVAAITKGLTSLMEPILIVMVGFWVTLLMIAIYLPVFTATTSVGGY